MIKLKMIKPNNPKPDFIQSPTAVLDNFSLSIQDVYNTTAEPDYITLDGLGINLNDTNKGFYQDGDYVGLVWSGLSDGNRFVDGYIWFMEDTPDTPKPLSSYGPNFTIEFYGDCCEKFSLGIFDGEDLHTDVMEVPVENGVVQLSIKDLEKFYPVYGIVLNNFYTEEASQWIKISTVSFGAITIFTEVIDSEVNEEINILSDDLPISTFNATVVNTYNEAFKKDYPIYVYNDNLFFGKFYVTEVERTGENVYSLQAENAVGRLDKVPYDDWGEISNVYGDRTAIVYLSDFCSEIERRTKMKIDTSGISDINRLNIEGVVKPDTCRYALCAVAFCLGYVVDGTRSEDNIVLKKIPTELKSIILPDRILGDSKLNESDDISSAVIINSEFINIGAVGDDITVKLDGTVIGTRYRQSWDKPRYARVAPNGSVRLYKNNFNYMEYELTSAVSEIDTGIAVLGQRVEVVNNPNAEIENVVTYDEFSDIIGNKGGSRDFVSRAEDVGVFIKSRGTVSAKIVLNGEKVGDIVKIQTAWDGDVVGIITSMTTKLGGTNVADVEIFEWKGALTSSETLETDRWYE